MRWVVDKDWKDWQVKEAISMYFGGDIIAAADCDFITSREMGLKCPICSSAVFIRSGSIRKVKGRDLLINPYFAHYPSGVVDNWDCENRANTSQGMAEIKRIKIEARNQRLKLYNFRLWELIAKGHQVSHRQLNQSRSIFGERWCEQKSILVRYEWAKAIGDVYTFIDSSIADVRNIAKNSEHYLLKCDLKMHQAICNEVAEFLGTNTAGFAFLKIFKLSLLHQLNAGGEKWTKKQIMQANPIAHIVSISALLSTVPWLDLIQLDRTHGKDPAAW